jgi:F-type H+/Na+-transporting ATPase subunit alpha
VVQIYAATNGYLDRIVVDKVNDFLDGLTQRFRSEQEDLLETISDGNWDDSTVEAVEQAVSEFADDFGYDLDEEGEPIEEGESDRASRREDEEEGEDEEEPSAEEEGEGEEEEDEEAKEEEKEEEEEEEQETAGAR